MQIESLQMKRALRTALLVLLLGAVGMGKGYAQNYDFSAACSTGQTLYYKIKSDGTSVSITYPTQLSLIVYGTDIFYSGYPKPTGSLVIPSSVTYGGVEYSVNSISHSAFCYCTGLTSVTIPNSIIYIDRYAFYSCNNLNMISIPNSLSCIYHDAFTNTKWYDNQPNGILYLGDWCIGYKGSKPSGQLTIRNGTTGIAGNSFYKCTELSSIDFPNSIQIINERAFYECSSLIQVSLPNAIQTINLEAFYNCSSLTQITIPTSLTLLDNRAFGHCTNLKKVFFNATDCHGYYCFLGCTNVTLTIGTTVQTIPNAKYWFNDLKSIIVDPNNPLYDSRENCNAVIETATNTLVYGCKTTVIPNSVTKIGEFAFYLCNNLQSITISDSITEIGENAFYKCSNLTSLNIEALNCTLQRFSFNECEKLANLRIGNNVQHITNNYSTVSYYLLSIEVSEGNTHYQSVDGVLFDFGKDTLILYPLKKEGGYSIPDGTKVIGERSFFAPLTESNLTSVTIPSTIELIETDAFSSCRNLNTIISYCVVPPTLVFNPFSNISPTAKLWVPCGTRQEYYSHWYWPTPSNTFPFEECETYSISVTPNIIGGIVTPSVYEAETNELITLEITPDSEYELQSLTVCNINDTNQLVTVTNNTFTMPSFDVIISATFEQNSTYSITITSNNEGGNVTVSSTNAQIGDEVQITVTPNTGMTFSSLAVCNANDPSQTVPVYLIGKNSYTYGFLMPSYDVVVKAVFVEGNAVGEGNSIAVSVYPNPTNSHMKIKAEDLKRITISNMLGQVIYQGKASGNEFTYDFSQSVKGVYLIRIETASGVVTKRVAVTR